jgi:tetratricopeptide (TPR) repeat protein
MDSHPIFTAPKIVQWYRPVFPINNYGFDIAVHASPKFFAPYLARARAYIGIGRYDLAFDDLDKAINLNPNVPRSYSLRGHLHSLAGEKGKAVEDFQRALSLGVESSEKSQIVKELQLLRTAAQIKRKH